MKWSNIGYQQIYAGAREFEHVCDVRVNNPSRRGPQNAPVTRTLCENRLYNLRKSARK